MSLSSSKTFYGCPLPKNLVDYRSSESRTRLGRALQTGSSAVPYLALTSCYTTQSKPNYCGLSTLAIILNSLQINPDRCWKGVWRWYTDELLDYSISKVDLKVSGTTLEEFVWLAECNGANATLVRPNNSMEQFDEYVESLERVCTGSRKPANDQNFDEKIPKEFMAVSYSRAALGQVGVGHFSPIAALDRETSSVLLLDTERYKYPPHWIPVELLFQAMLPIDIVTGKSRGYVVLEAKHK
ncbi:uncharacterized protein LOC144657181 [Oculina patagonica]